MIDKRLRQLDQIPEITYWRDDYEELKAGTMAEKQAEMAARQTAVFAKSRAKWGRQKKENKPVSTLLPAANLRVRISTDQSTTF